MKAAEGFPLRMKKSHVSRPVRVCVVVGGEVALLPHFLRHYRELGVDSFHIVVHFQAENDPIGRRAVEVLHAHGLEPEAIHLSDRPFLGNRDLIAQIKEQYPDDWFLPVDLDEFQVYPRPLAAIVAKCEARDYGYVLGCLVDRLAADGSLPPVTADDRWPQFPLAGSLHAIHGAFPEKVVLCRGRIPLNAGQHAALSGQGCPWHEIYTQVHHFKWVAGLTDRLRNLSQQVESINGQGAMKAYADEGATFVRYMEEHGGKIDINDPRFLLAPAGPDYRSYRLWPWLVKACKGRRPSLGRRVKLLVRRLCRQAGQ
jgi:hypothetical protein